jgi:hypothetical protein
MLKSLPTALSFIQVDELLSQFPSSCEVTRHPSVVSVRATNRKGEKVKLFSAVSQDGLLWHAMALDGLISTSN